MDHLRIFIESAFYRAKDCLIRDYGIADYADLSDKEFMGIARKHATNLSDDALRLVFRLYRDDWNHDENKGSFPVHFKLPQSSKIFNCIFEASSRVLSYDFHSVRVRFDDLFRWREITRFIGEDVFVTALLAMHDSFSSTGRKNIGERLAYPPTLRNDNVDIDWLVRQGRLHELHTHLRASANVFNINWCCLMNHPEDRHAEINRMLANIDIVVDRTIVDRINELIVWAATFRYHAFLFLRNDIQPKDVRESLRHINPLTFNSKATRLRATIEALALVEGGAALLSDPDYIRVPDPPEHCYGDFRVYLGERYFLYLALQYIICTEDREFVANLHKYLLVKSLVRDYMIQLNSNHGFGNFQRYQNNKSYFTNPHPAYSRMLEGLAIADAWRDSNIAYQEVRIVPNKSLSKGIRELMDTVRNIRNELSTMRQPQQSWSNKEPGFFNTPDFGIIYHFIKTKDNFDSKSVKRRSASKKNIILFPRNHNIRKFLRSQSENIRIIYRNQHSFFIDGFSPVKAIDAASSEFNCRPEAFGQAFRFLKRAGLRATFHAGEDYYDIVDGLRAIDESITFLGMTGGDRIGHAIAMGIDPYEFYNRTANHIVVPAQWMLDNVVWLLFRSADWNISLESQVESFLRQKFEELYYQIYGGNFSSALPPVTAREYYQSLLLRSDNPDCYINGSLHRLSAAGSPLRQASAAADSWQNFELLDSPKARMARTNPRVRELYIRYHFEEEVRAKGNNVIELKVCKGYASLIEKMQHRLMRRLERRHIVIECCPSSNFLIGSLHSYRKHPAFRFYSVGQQEPHHLKVTLNTDDLGVFQTSLANEYSYMALALSKERNSDGNHLYMPDEIRQWLAEVAENGEKCRF